MMNKTLRQLVGSRAGLLIAVLAVALLGSCGGGGSTPGPSPNNPGTTLQSPAHYTQDLAAALAELEGLECPEGADPEVFAQIKRDARRMLIDKYSGKQVSDYNPTHDHVKVRQFDWDSGGTYGKLVWIYVNDGDYNQDSTVNSSDITPLAAHYDEEVTGDNTIQELIDEDDEPNHDIEDGDGLVDGEENQRYDYNDLDTIIGFNWNTYIDHYSVQGATSPVGSWTEVDTVDFEDYDEASEGEARYRFHWDISTTSYAYFKVVPVGGPGTFPSSEHSEVIRLSPDVTSVTWSASPKSGESSTATVHLADTDIPAITGYSWNFDGGATPNTSNQEHPTVTFGRGDTYDAWVEVTNAFGTDHYDFDLVVQAQWHIETVDARDSKCTSLAFDSDDNPGISYWASNYVRYVKYDGEDWNEEFTQRQSTAFPGYSTSLAYDGDDIAYIAFPAGIFACPSLTLAFEDDPWNVEVVNEDDAGFDCSLALEPPSGDPCISYFQMVDDEDWLIYSEPGPSSWLHHEVSPELNMGYCVGTSLAFNSSGRPTISFYHDTTSAGLVYASYDGSEWDLDSVESGLGKGHWSSLAYNAVGSPAISHFDGFNRDLRYSYLQGTWQSQLVDGGGAVGVYTSLGFDGDGYAVISYYDDDNANLKVAWQSGVSWDIDTLDSSGDIGTYTSLAIDSYGCPGISYGGDDLRFALWW